MMPAVDRFDPASVSASLVAAEIAKAQRENSRAYRDAMKAIARDMPDPAEFAGQLKLVYVQALVHSRVCPEGWRIADGFETAAPAMRRGGLVDVQSYCLTAFGLKVRAALIAEGA